VQCVPKEIRVAIILEDVGKTLLDLSSDPVELVREKTLSLLARFLEEDGECGVASRLLTLLFPAFSSRVGTYPALEEAEELRLQWGKLLTVFLSRADCHAVLRMGRFFEDTCEVLKTLAADSYHSIKCEAVAGVGLLCAAVPERVHHGLGGLAGACVGCLGHQRGPVRGAALGALATLLPLGGDTLPSVLHDTVLPPLRIHLRFDRTPSVRRALASACAGWLGGGLPAYVLKSRNTEAILVHMLTGLCSDETEEVATCAYAALIDAAHKIATACGEGGGSIRNQGMDLEAAAEAAMPSAGHCEMSCVLAQRTADFLAGGGGGGGGGVSFGTPPNKSLEAFVETRREATEMDPIPKGLRFAPLLTRPPPPLLSLVSRTLHPAMTLALEELKDWTVKTRLCAAGSLKVLVALGEGGVVQLLEGLVAALCTGSRDEEGAIRIILGDVGKLMGALVPPAAQLGVLLPILGSGGGGGGGVGGSAEGVGEPPLGLPMKKSSGGGEHSSSSDRMNRLSTLVAVGGGSGAIAQSSPMASASALAVLSAALSSMSRDSIIPLLPHLSHTLSLPHLAESDPPALRNQLALCLAYLARALTHDDGSQSAAAVSLLRPFPLPLLRTLLHLEDTSSSPEVLSSASHSGALLARLAGYESETALLAAEIGPLLDVLTAGSENWSAKCTERRALDALLRRHRSSLCGPEGGEHGGGPSLYVTKVLATFAATLAPSRDPELRLHQLVLLDSWLS